jgi:hypothetical protein
LIFHHSVHKNTTSNRPYLLCRQVPGRPGFGLQEFDASYSPVAEPVFSELDLKVAEQESSKGVELLGELAGTGSGGAQAFDKLKFASAGLAGGSAVLAVATFFVRI